MRIAPLIGLLVAVTAACDHTITVMTESTVYLDGILLSEGSISNVCSGAHLLRTIPESNCNFAVHVDGVGIATDNCALDIPVTFGVHASAEVESPAGSEKGGISDETLIIILVVVFVVLFCCLGSFLSGAISCICLPLCCLKDIVK